MKIPIKNIQKSLIRYKTAATSIVLSSFTLALFTACPQNNQLVEKKLGKMELFDNLLVNHLFTTDINKLFAEFGVQGSESSAAIYSKALDYNSTCGAHTYPSLSDIDYFHLQMSHDPRMNKTFCKNKVTAALGYCETLKQLGYIGGEVLHRRMQTDTAFFHQVHQMRLFYNLKFGGPISSNGFFSFFSVVHEWRIQAAEGIRNSGRRIENLYVGDSIMHLFEIYLDNQKIKDTLTGSAFLPLARERSDSMLYRLGHHLSVLRPKNVIISISGNDIIQNCDAEKVDQNRKEMVALMKSFGVEKIIWFSLPGLADQKANSKVIAENLKIQSMPGVTFIDMYTPTTILGLPSPDFSLDGTHVKEVVYRDLWIPKLKELGVLQ